MAATPAQLPTPDVPAVAVLVFDGDCGFCTTCAGFVTRVAPDVTAVPWQHADLLSLGLDEAVAAAAVQLVTPDGVSAGAAAVAGVLRRGRRPWPLLGAVLGWPGLRLLADVVYRVVARNRHRLPGGTPACRLPR